MSDFVTLKEPFFANQQGDLREGGKGWPVSDEHGHLCVIVGSRFDKSVSNPENGMLTFSERITGGPHDGKEFTLRLNLFNQTPKAVEIAKRDLARIAFVCGIGLQDSSNTRLYANRPHRVHVALQDGEEAQLKGWTEVVGYSSADGTKPWDSSFRPSSNSKPAVAESDPFTAASAPQISDASTSTAEIEGDSNPWD